MNAISSDIEEYLKRKELVKLFDQFLGAFSDMAEDGEFWLRGYDDLGNEYVFNLISYDKPNLIFELKDSEISSHANQLTLQLYRFTGATGEIVSYEQKESGDAAIEEIGYSWLIGKSCF